MKTATQKRNGWKIFGIAAILFAFLSLVLKGCGHILSNIPSVPDDYTKKAPTGGELEAKYLAAGSHEVEYFESGAMMSFQKFEIYYPKDIDSMDKLPVVIFVNGTGVKGSKYPALQKHLASWGFITVATEEEYAWNGFSAEMSVRYLEVLNQYREDGKENVFYGKIDLDRIGITGHSQGGIGVINAVTDQKHSDIYKAAVLLSSTETDMAKAFFWESDSSLIRTNTLMIASTGQRDSTISPLEGMQKTYRNITDAVAKVMARRNDCDHGEMLYYADGYVTAWFMYYLKDDAEAGGAFFGDSPEISSNALYQDVQITPGKSNTPPQAAGHQS
ncbi:MAG: alpha/beta hydrolase [bacterium]|nr:alpha/beta hydrolase [bacterium]